MSSYPVYADQVINPRPQCMLDKHSNNIPTSITLFSLVHKITGMCHNTWEEKWDQGFKVTLGLRETLSGTNKIKQTSTTTHHDNHNSDSILVPVICCCY